MEGIANGFRIVFSQYQATNTININVVAILGTRLSPRWKRIMSLLGLKQILDLFIYSLGYTSIRIPREYLDIQ